MPYLGFRVRDTSTDAPLGDAPALAVLVPRPGSALPPSGGAPRPWPGPDAEPGFFATARNRSGDVVVLDVPAGIHPVEIRAAGYVPRRARARSPGSWPVCVRLHRSADYPFAADDTLLLGTIVRSSGAPGAGLHVRLIDPDPAVPGHRVPVDARGRYVVYVPEKRSRSAVTLAVAHASGVARVEIEDVIPHRTHVAPLIVVP
ncbi:hypothetical protein [Sorangium cellulosum]|uniref:Uncharacterized protein n=1 Tax=Sorangium cellulosum So0157-2 TaxID=1254432 RepID=S4XUG7_SORCE|nr:hypothetical protein [Sorangium cellulosum]AGP35520.1 hypothetical protein SCE1572_13860 [Sorangium cellulosum So0157-2]